jgi:hypothetical protein
MSNVDMDEFHKPYEENEHFIKKIAPFSWVESDAVWALCLNALDGYKKDVFTARSGEGFRGNGYDWASLASVFLEEKSPNLKEAIKPDPETGMFVAYSSNEDALAEFAVAFKDVCEDDTLIRDLFSRAGTDHIFDENNLNEEERALFRQSQELQKNVLAMMKEAGGESIFGEEVFEKLVDSGDLTTKLFKLLNVKEDQETNGERTNDD